MDATSAELEVSRNPIEAVKGALAEGFGRYRALKDAPESRKLLLGCAGTRIGYRASTVALVALSYKLGDGALGVGGMIAILLGPSMLVQPLAGSLVDRFQGKRTLVATTLLTAMLVATYMLLTATPSIWLLYTITLAMGIVQTFDMPAVEIRLMKLTPRTLRGTANAVQMLAITAGEIAGPVIGGLLLALAGVNAVFAFQIVMLLMFAGVIQRLPERVAGATSTEDDEADQAEEAPAKGSGYLSLLRRQDVRLFTGVVMSTYLLLYGTVTLYIVRAGELGLGDGSVGLFYTVMGVGSFVGSVLAGMGGYATKRALGVAGIASVIAAMAFVLFGAAGSVFLALPALVLVGMVGDIEEIAAMTWFQNNLPERYYARFFSVFMMAASIGGLIGSLGAPLLSERLSTGATMTILAIPAIVMGATFAIREGGVRFGLPPFAPQAEPEVAGHGLFRSRRTPVDLVEERIDGRPVLAPLTTRLPI
jgi:MFS family permease